MWGLPGGLYYRLGQAWEACAHRDSQRVGNIHSLMYTSPLGILGGGGWALSREHQEGGSASSSHPHPKVGEMGKVPGDLLQTPGLDRESPETPACPPSLHPRVPLPTRPAGSGFWKARRKTALFCSLPRLGI